MGNATTLAHSAPLINPLLDLEPTLDYSELRPFKHRIEQFIASTLRSDSVRHISVYFRDLNNGPLFGINEKERFTPASLLKVPLMIAVLI